nr:DUF1016 N-terminal domain-containing protein [Kineococcus radiotolerans]
MPARDLEPPSHDAGAPTSTAVDLPAGYSELLEQLEVRAATSRVRAARAANTELLHLHHSTGRDMLQRQHDAGWGAEVIDRLAHDLRDAFPDQRGSSRANLHSMRAFAATWPDQESFVQQAVGQLPWGHITVLLAHTKDPAVRDWYAAAVEHGWSRNVLTHQIMSHLHLRSEAAPSNFATQLPAPDSGLRTRPAAHP